MKILKYNYLTLALVLGLTFACSKKQEEQPTEDNPITQEDLESYEASSSTGADEIKYEGTYAGTVKGVAVELELKANMKFKLKEGNINYSGTWIKLDDGTKIALESESGTPKTNFYMWSDNDNWIGLNQDEELPENEEFIKRK